jgi:hypothetical protein
VRIFLNYRRDDAAGFARALSRHRLRGTDRRRDLLRHEVVGIVEPAPACAQLHAVAASSRAGGGGGMFSGSGSGAR